MWIVFIGRRSFANHRFVHWLAQRQTVVACFRANLHRSPCAIA